MSWILIFIIPAIGLYLYARSLEKRSAQEIESEPENVLSLNTLSTEEALSPTTKEEGNYISRSLLSAAERKFFQALKECLSSQATVLTKVRLADLIRADASDYSKTQSLFNKISRKHIDFVICQENDLSVLGLIELDDASHLRQKRRERDEFVDDALQRAGLKILRIQVERTYKVEELKQQLYSELEISMEFLS